MKRVAFVAVALLAGLSVFVAKKWNTWFYNPGEAAYEASYVPWRIMLTPGDSLSTSRNVSWQCDTVVRPSHVLLAGDADTVTVDAVGEVYASRAGKAAYYVARLRGLKAGCSYRYQVVSGDSASSWASFDVPADGDRCSLLFVGDVQDTIGGVFGQMLGDSLVRSLHPDMIVCGGDLVERPTDALWGQMFDGFGGVCRSIPVLNVTGNHDYLKYVIRKLERRFSLVFSYYLDSQIGYVPGDVYSGSQVFTTTQGNVQIFCLDSNRELPYLAEQSEWLEEQLKTSKARWKVVVAHHPLYSTRGKMNNLTQRMQFADLMQKYGVDLVLQGHEHAYARFANNGSGTPSTPVYTVSHCSPKHYHIKFFDRFEKYGSGDRYFQMIRSTADTLSVVAYCLPDGDEPHPSPLLYDSLSIVKGNGRTTICDFGPAIPERVNMRPTDHSKSFRQRVEDYKAEHPERFW